MPSHQLKHPVQLPVRNLPGSMRKLDCLLAHLERNLPAGILHVVFVGAQFVILAVGLPFVLVEVRTSPVNVDDPVSLLPRRATRIVVDVEVPRDGADFAGPEAIFAVSGGPEDDRRGPECGVGAGGDREAEHQHEGKHHTYKWHSNS